MSRKQPEDEHVKKMADLLRQGATLTELACPACSSPLFRLRNGDLWCAKDEKKVIIVREGEEQTQTASSPVLDKLESTLLTKIQDIQKRIEQTQDMNEIMQLNSTLSGLLDSLEKLKKAKKR